MTDPTERESRDQAIKATLADPKARHHEVVAEAELNVDYSLSPIVCGDANSYLAAGKRLPHTIQVQRSHEQPCRLHELAHRAGHTLMLLGGPNAHGPALVELHTALKVRIEKMSSTICSKTTAEKGTYPSIHDINHSPDPLPRLQRRCYLSDQQV